MNPTETFITDFSKSKQLQGTAHALIPGGCHTYAKGDDQYPENAPGFIERGEGCRVWDIDGNEFIEYGGGLRAVTLGHAYAPVVAAAHRQMQLGNNFTRPARIEVDCARQLLDLIQGAEQVKFAKDGSAVTTAAIKLARAYTGRERVAVCAQDPFISYNDWFIGTTPIDRGVIDSARRNTDQFQYDDLTSLQSLFQERRDEIACVVMEPARLQDPSDGFLQGVKDLCHSRGAILIFDEMITGFRWHLGGAQAHYGVVPDLSTFGKAMANGFALSALVGKREIMNLGGINHNAERVFLLSTTHGAENHALAAAMETMRVYVEEDVVAVLHRQGKRLRESVNQVIAELDMEGHFEVLGRDCNLVFATRDEKKEPSQPYRTLFMQEMIRRGILAPSFVVSFSHSDDDIDRTVEAVRGSLEVYRMALNDGVGRYLQGRPVKPVYRKYN